MKQLYVFLIAALAIVATVGVLVWLVKRGTFEPAATNVDSDDERRDVARQRDEPDFTIPLRKRYKALPGPARALIVALGLLSVGVGVAVYRFLQTGHPVDQQTARYLMFVGVAGVGLVAGVRLDRWSDHRVRWAYIVYERPGSEPQTEKIPFMSNKTDYRDGQQIIKEVASSRLFGIVWRYRQVAERRELRSSKSLPEDVVEHALPEHAVELGDGNVMIRTREDGDEVIDGVESADKTYASPRTLSQDEAIRIRAQNRRMYEQMKQAKAMEAELFQEIRELRKKIRNREYKERTDLVEDLGDLMESFEPLLSEHTNSHQTDQRQLTQNGEEADS